MAFQQATMKLSGYEVTPEVRARADELERSAAANPSSAEDLQVYQGGDIRARWKIQVMFGPKRTLQGPNGIELSIWESAKHLHGGGDALAFQCRDARAGHSEGCGGIIPQDNVNKSGVAFCPNCQRTVDSNLLPTGRVGIFTSQQLAEILVEWFYKLGSNADIYLKYDQYDPRYRAMARQRGEAEARKLRGLHMYRLKNILRDTATGADLTKRMKAFITS